MKTLFYRARRLILCLILIVTLGLTSSGSAGAQQPPDDIPTIDPALLAKAERSDSLDYLIAFEDQADLSAAYTLPWEERGWYVYDTLTAFADETQAEVQAYLDAEGVTYQSYWAANMIAVSGSSRATLEGLLDYWVIDSLQTIPTVFLSDGTLEEISSESAPTRAASDNLTRIKVDQVWNEGYTGAGMVVGSIDTGVRYTHDALVTQYRGNLGGSSFNHNYSWWDAVTASSAPVDDHWHGTHTTGIMVGDDGGTNHIGVAPGAEWIACKALDWEGSGTGTDLFECGQFMLAPYDLNGQNPNPNMRPDVVNNSWGACSDTYNDWYESTIDAWLAAGIYPVFANGNASGPGCANTYPPGLNTVSNPARSHHVTAVGSTGTSDGVYADHSNWGPTDDPDTLNANGYPNIKPQVVAPGVSIRSAVNSSNTDYEYWSGTSMAAPHVAGLVALIWQAQPGLRGNYTGTETLLQLSATSIPYATGNGDEGPGNVPNHATGWGEIDALAAVEWATQALDEVCYLPMFLK